MNVKPKLTRRTLRTIAHSLMVNAIFLEAYIHFALIYTADNIFPVLPIKDLINKDGKPTTSFKLATDMKPSITHLHVLFCPGVLQKATSRIGTKALKCITKRKRVFLVSLLESHSIKKGILFMYHTNGRSYICKTSFLMRFYLVRWHTRHNHM